MNDPRSVLLGAQALAGHLPVCDHYSGVADRMRKSIALQAEMIEEFGACVFDVSLDCEDGAPVGAERDHALLVRSLAEDATAAAARVPDKAKPRIAARLHPVDHPAFEQDVGILAPGAVGVFSHFMLPKVEHPSDVDRAVASLAGVDPEAARSLPLHVLLESPAAIHRAFDIAAHPRVQSISFGLMDFVSAHGGAVPAAAMRGDGQFLHPLVVRAKLELASACHAHGKVPAHGVVTEFRDLEAITRSARRAAAEFGFTRMWSIHPAQIRPIIEAFAPSADEVAEAAEIIGKALAVAWAPVSHAGQLHDRASYRYFWQTLERAHRTGHAMPEPVQALFSPKPSLAPGASC